MTSWASALTLSRDTAGTACLLTAEGVLDSSTYLQLRDAIVKAALDGPSAVLVDVDGLDVPATSAWAVFTSARWYINTWPDIPVMLVCASARRRDIARRSMTRSVSVHATVETALAARVDESRHVRRRASVDLPPSLASLRQARALVRGWLTAWRQPDLIPVATVITNVFVENALLHTGGPLILSLEFDGTAVTVAVRDESPILPARHEDPCRGGEPVSGLAIVASVCRNWGSAPMSTGKTVWAQVGPENKL